MSRDLVVIIETERQPARHVWTVRKWCPDADVTVWRSPPARCPRTAWRNADRDIRAAWADLRRDAGRVVFLEADVAMAGPLPDVRPEGAAWRTVTGGPLPRWKHWREVQALPDDVRPHALGGFPLAVTIMSTCAAGAMLDPRWDSLFAQDIFCEVRLPTVIRASGYPVEAAPLPGVAGYLHDPRDDRAGPLHPRK